MERRTLTWALPGFSSSAGGRDPGNVDVLPSRSLSSHRVAPWDTAPCRAGAGAEHRGLLGVGVKRPALEWVATPLQKAKVIFCLQNAPEVCPQIRNGRCVVGLGVLITFQIFFNEQEWL